MNFDISHLLEQWDYQPGQVVVRRFAGKDGVEKIQLRVDLGLLQMNAAGRPDGKRPLGHPSLLDYYKTRLQKHRDAYGGSDDEFALVAEDCAKLQLEALQYHHRYICLLQLEDFAAVVRDAERNLAVFDFVEKFAESDELAWSLLQFKPQLLMLLTRARATQSLRANDYALVTQQIHEGIEEIRNFFREHLRGELMEQSGEIQSLENWLAQISAQRPLTEREKLEKALQDAIQNEDYQKAAQLRDVLRDLKTKE